MTKKTAAKKPAPKKTAAKKPAVEKVIEFKESDALKILNSDCGNKDKLEQLLKLDGMPENHKLLLTSMMSSKRKFEILTKAYS